MRAIGDLLRNTALPVHKVTEPNMNVYNLIAKVSADLCQHGISKDRKNAQQSYNFRGIDDVYNALAPIISKHGLVILPRVMRREVSERMGKSGSSLFYVVVEAEFDFVSSHDGTKHTVKTFGEAMDSGDKATNKAMSAAYKYAAFQAFCIPTEGDNDADATTHEVKANSEKKPSIDDHIKTLSEAKTVDELKAAWTTSYKEFKNDPQAINQLDAAKEQRKKELTEIK
jgi:hypothetical protein